MRPFRLFLMMGLFLMIGSRFALAGAAPRDIPFESAAQKFLARHGFEKAQPTEIGLDQVLAKSFVHTRLGLFEIWFPADALEKRAEDLKQCAAAVLTAQEQWLEWIEPAGAEQKALLADRKALAEWVQGWKTLAKARADVSEVGGKDLLELTAASPGTVEAAQRFGDAIVRGVPLGASPASADTVRLFLMPTRKDFVEFLCFVGLTLPAHRNKFWLESAGDWTQCFVEKDQAIALEYAVAKRKNGEYETGMGMNEKNATTMQQQVVQLAMNSLFDHFYAGRVPAAFTQGLSLNLVIDQFGDIHTRVDGDVRSRVTNAREMFVPGGIDNGILPVNSAETYWRENHGKDHFIRALRLSQKDGDDLEKKVKNRLACFRIVADDEVKRMAVVAPFLGAAGASSAPTIPPEFRGDFEELMRAYKSGFIHWLQTKAGGSEKSSREKFAKLLVQMADPKKTTGFEAIFAEIYDKAPLSGPEANKDTLEGKFLVWLSKQ